MVVKAQQRNGLLEQMYADICTRLTQLVSSTGKPIFETVDFWNNQWAHLSEEPAFAFPSCFVEFKDIPFTQLGGKVQQGNVMVSLHIGSKNIARSKHSKGEANKWTPHLRLLDATHLLFSGWGSETGYMGSWSRVATSPDHDHDEITSHIQTFRFTVKDYSAVPDYIKVNGDKLIITME